MPCNHAIVDYSILADFTVQELDAMQQKMGTWEPWCSSGARNLFYQREQIEVDIVLGLIDNQWGFPIRAKQAIFMKEDRGG